MRYRSELTVQEVPKRGTPYVWVPERVPDCPQRACRRARKCMRREWLPSRAWPDWPSCPLLTDDEWSVWSAGMLRYLTGPRERLTEEVTAACEAARKALRPRK